jgi:CRISPR-associated endoribonuclease Cas6
VRLVCEVSTRADHLPWDNLIKPGRGIVYGALRAADPALADRLHEHGWGRWRMAPFGYGAPTFPRARRTRGVYTVAGPGRVEIGSPVTEILHAIADGLAGQKMWDWGGTALHVRNISAVFPPRYTERIARFRAQAVLLKGSNRDEDGAYARTQHWLLPGEPEWPVYFERNLRRKAETLDLDPAVSLEQVTWIGPKRSMGVGKGRNVCAGVEVVVSGPPATLQAIGDWSLGVNGSAGFGWIQR